MTAVEAASASSVLSSYACDEKTGLWVYTMPTGRLFHCIDEDENEQFFVTEDPSNITRFGNWKSVIPADGEKG